MGSLAALDDGDVFDELASDIDIAIVVDSSVLPVDAERYPDGKFTVYGGCMIQAIFLSLEVLEDDQKLLSMLGLGCNLRRAHVLSDASGGLGAARRKIAQRWGEQQWLVRRTDRAIEFAEQAVADLSSEVASIPRLVALCQSLMQLSGLVAIAHGETPTHRRSLAQARPLLESHGRHDLVAGLLQAIGADQADEKAVEWTISDALEALRIERRYGQDSADLSPAFQEALPDFFAAGVRDLVKNGSVQEAMLPAVAGVAMSAWLAHPVASVEDRASLVRLADGVLERIGAAPVRWPARQRLITALAADVTAFCRSTSRA